jgi:hypothetical protein
MQIKKAALKIGQPFLKRYMNYFNSAETVILGSPAIFPAVPTWIP